VRRQPQPVALDSSRRSVHEIFEGGSRNTREELNRSSRALAFSGVAGGVTMGLTGLAVAIAQAVLGFSQSAGFVSYLFLSRRFRFGDHRPRLRKQSTRPWAKDC
jgi:formate-nitrite transporter family protein